MNLQAEKEYIQNVEKQIRDLELEEVKLNQQKEYAEKAIEDNLKKITDLGFTPETIEQGIESLSSNIAELKSKINSVLNVQDSEAVSDANAPF